MKLCDFIRVQRERRKWSQRQLAARAGLSNTTISRIEGGEEVSPSLDTLLRLAEALDVPIAEMLASADVVLKDGQSLLAHLPPDLAAWITDPANIDYLKVVRAAAQEGASSEDLALAIEILRRVRAHYWGGA